MAKDYLEIYNMIETNTFFTSRDVGIPSATLGAMVRRGFLSVASEGSPKKYIKNQTKVPIIMEKSAGIEYFGLYKKDKELGMTCRIKNGVIVDCYDKPYDITGVYKIRIKGQEFLI